MKLTHEQITALAQENGPAYWRVLIESTFFILDKDSKKVPLIFTPAQDDYWNKITARDIIDKSRKLGFTTIRLARMLAKCSQVPNRKAIIVSAEGEATERILGRVKELIDNCVMDLGAEVFENTIRFKKTKSVIWIGTAGSKTFGRGDDITDVLLTEFAHWLKPDVITGIENACTRDSEICIESTANGYGNHFHKIWLRAIASAIGREIQPGPQPYTPHFYGWNWDPMCFVECRPIEEYDAYEKTARSMFDLSDGQIMWRRLTMRSMFDPNLFPQEYPLTWEESFLQSGFMVFDPHALHGHEKAVRPILWQGEIKDSGDKATLEIKKDGRLRIWVNPHPRDQYILTADVGSGIIGGTKDTDKEGDYSVWDVYSLSTCEQVAQWHGHIAPDLFGDIGVLLGAFYNFGILIPEINNHGFTTVTIILGETNQYPNVHHREEMQNGTKAGWYTSPGKSGTRVLLVNNARAAVRDYTVKLNSLRTITECRTFVTTPENEVGEAQIGCKDDCVIALGIAATMLKVYAGIPEQKATDAKPRLGYRDNIRPKATAPRAGGYK